MAAVLRKSTHTVSNAKCCGGNMDSSSGGILPPVGELNNIFDDITKEENSNGSTDYRCIYFSNEANSSEPVSNLKVKILSQGTTQFELGPIAKNSPAEAITTEITQPSGVSFYSQQSIERANSDGYLPFPGAQTLLPGEYVGLWIKRITRAAQGSGIITEDLVLDFTWVS